MCIGFSLILSSTQACCRKWQERVGLKLDIVFRSQLFKHLWVTGYPKYREKRCIIYAVCHPGLWFEGGPLSEWERQNYFSEENDNIDSILGVSMFFIKSDCIDIWNKYKQKVIGSK